jgi:hypothetical protein
MVAEGEALHTTTAVKKPQAVLLQYEQVENL